MRGGRGASGGYDGIVVGSRRGGCGGMIGGCGHVTIICIIIGDNRGGGVGDVFLGYRGGVCGGGDGGSYQ